MIATFRPDFTTGYREKVISGLRSFQVVLPSLAERREDIEPNFDHTLGRIDQRRGVATTFDPGAREEYLDFATSRLGVWRDGFHDLVQSAERLVEAAGDGGVISAAVVRREITFLAALWGGEEPDPAWVVSGETAETPGLPSLEHEIPTRNEVYRAELVRLARRADTPDPQMIVIAGPPGAGRTSLARRYAHRRRLRGHVGAQLIEFTATGDDRTDCTALLGHHDAYSDAPPSQAGLLVDAGEGVVIIHHVERLGPGGQYALLAVHEARGRLPLTAFRGVVVRAHVIALVSRPLAHGYRPSLDLVLDERAFRAPGLKQRLRELEPSIDHLLRTLSVQRGGLTSFAPDARAEYLDFASGHEAEWDNNFEDLERSIGRLVTAAQGGLISIDDVDAEIELICNEWAHEEPGTASPGEGHKAATLRRSLAKYGLTFEGIKAASAGLPPLKEEPRSAPWDVLRREVPELSPAVMKRIVRVDAVVLAVMVRECRASKSEWDASQELFHVPTEHRRNRIPQLRDYLARFGLTYARLKGD